MLFPGNDQCIALLLSFNLASHQWIDIPCTRNLAMIFVCQLNTSETLNNQNVSLHPVRIGCNPDAFKINVICFLFVWWPKISPFSAVQLCQAHNMLPFLTEDINDLVPVFDTIDEASFIVVSQKRYQSGPIIIFTHTRIWLAHFTISKLEQPSENTKGFLICHTEVEPFEHEQGNLFRCPQNELISTLFVLDGVEDCSKQGTSQAGDEMCPVEEYHCHQWCLDNECNCSPVHYKSKTGECNSFLPKDQKQYRDFPQEPQLKKKMFKCNNGSLILSELTDDLFPDCISGADEPILTNLLKHGQSLKCPLVGQLLCKDGHPKCYSVSDICIYEVNEQHNLIPCRTGENLQSCLKFQCNFQFKCPKAYCISWSYVCDGVWNCPFGHDEQEPHSCGENRICQHIFKCWKSQVCVHVRETCNFKIDCPSADDEHLCQVEHLQCPINCFCLNLAIYCENVHSKLIPDSCKTARQTYCTLSEIISLKYVQQPPSFMR